jgi:ABC-type molybdate transport system substrate-binding protein
MARTPAKAMAVSALALLAALMACTAGAAVARAAEIKVLSTVALKAALDEDFLPQLERSAENKVTFKYDAAAAMSPS